MKNKNHFEVTFRKGLNCASACSIILSDSVLCFVFISVLQFEGITSSSCNVQNCCYAEYKN